MLAAQDIIHRNLLWSLGACVMPIPMADVLAVTAIQIKMMGELSTLYGVPFREPLARQVVLSLLGSLGGLATGVAFAFSVAKLIPGLGTVLGFLGIQASVGAFTHATGRMYLMHLESGGTLLDFDPRAVRAQFWREFAAGEQIARAARQTVRAPAHASTPTSCVAIVHVHYKGTVKRTQSDEYAELANRGQAEVDLSGWTLDADGTGQVFTFPPGTRLAAGQVVRVYTDEVHPETGGFKFGVRRAIWNDHGDRACLRDAAGVVVSEFAYGNKR